MRHFVVIAASMAAFGCTSTLKREDVANSGRKLERGGLAVVASPMNGSYGANSYSASGGETATATAAAFARHATETRVIAGCTAIACLRQREATAKYYAVPEILHWEDRATEWSGIKDKLEIKLTIYEAANPAPVASTILSGKSKFMTFGGDHPQDLLPRLIGTYVESLYAR